MAKVYLKPGDRAETLCEVICAGDGAWEEPHPIPDAPIRLFREDERLPDGGDWFLVRPDFDGTQRDNPRWGEYYYDDEKPEY